MIRLFTTTICEEAKQAAVDVLASGWVGAGEKVAEFEKAFAKFCGTKYAVATNSATAALDLAVRVLNLPINSSVITTPYTFVSTNHVLLYNYFTPVFMDIDSENRQFNLDLIRQRMINNPAVQAIMVVHYGGGTCDLYQLNEMAQERGIPVIEDAAHACGTRFDGRPVGSFGNLTCFSFHAVKNLPIGDGGMVVTNDEEQYERLRRLRWLGIDRSTYTRSKLDNYSWEYDVGELGRKYQMNDLAAAIGLEQLKHVEEWNERRRAIWQMYVEGFKETPDITPMSFHPLCTPSMHLASVLVPERDRVIRRLNQAGIEAGVHYKPNHLYALYTPFYSRFVSEAMNAYRYGLSLPMHLQLSDEDVYTVIEEVRRAVL